MRNVEFGIRKTDPGPLGDGWAGEFSIFNLKWTGGWGFIDYSSPMATAMAMNTAATARSCRSNGTMNRSHLS